jgi:hypothetical protein
MKKTMKLIALSLLFAQSSFAAIIEKPYEEKSVLDDLLLKGAMFCELDHKDIKRTLTISAGYDSSHSKYLLNLSLENHDNVDPKYFVLLYTRPVLIGSNFDSNGGFQIHADHSTGLLSFGNSPQSGIVDVDFIPKHPRFGTWTAKYVLDTPEFKESHELKCKLIPTLND